MGEAFREREPLPTREQIEAIADIPALEEIEQELERRRTQVEVDLEYASDKDIDWERRARGFLTAVLATLKIVRKQLHRLRTAGRVVPDNEAQLRAAEVRAAKKLAHETAEANARALKAQRAAEAAAQQAALNRKLIERTSYLHHFHTAAHTILSEELCRKVSEAASIAVQRELRAVLGEPA